MFAVPAYRAALFGRSWTPLALGSSLLAWWDASFGVVLSGSQVTNWIDRRNGYNVSQASSPLRPVWGEASFNGSPGVTFDGSDDYLEMGSQPFPSGSEASEIWAVVDQTLLASDTVARILFSYGGDTSTTRRGIQRNSNGTLQTGAVAVGTGASLSAVESSATLYGRLLIRAEIGSASSAMTIDGGTRFTGNFVPATGTSRVRMGALSNLSPGNYWKGQIRDIVVTSSLSSDNASRLQSFLLSRRNV